MSMRVDCESVAPGQFQPKLVWFGSRRVPVLSIVDRWYGPHHSWWKIDTEDGFYVLRRDDSSGEWELAAITRDEARISAIRAAIRGHQCA